MESYIMLAFMILSTYLIAGLTFSICFLSLGITRVDKDAEGTGWVFRLLLIPGMCALWPLFLFKWIHVKH